MKVPYEIWLCLAQWFLRRQRFKTVDDGRTNDGRRSLALLKAHLGALKAKAILAVSISWSKVLNKPFILMQEFSK